MDYEIDIKKLLDCIVKEDTMAYKHFRIFRRYIKSELVNIRKFIKENCQVQGMHYIDIHYSEDILRFPNYMPDKRTTIWRLDKKIDKYRCTDLIEEFYRKYEEIFDNIREQLKYLTPKWKDDCQKLKELSKKLKKQYRGKLDIEIYTNTYYFFIEIKTKEKFLSALIIEKKLYKYEDRNMEKIIKSIENKVNIKMKELLTTLKYRDEIAKNIKK